MRLMGCIHENAVWRSAVTGVWGPGLREHAANCPACREVVVVSEGLAGLAGQSPGLGTLPDPRQIWWRAHWLRSKAAEKAAWPVRLYQRIAAAGIVLSLVAAGFTYRTTITRWILVPQGQWMLFGVPLPAAAVTLSACAVAGLSVLLAVRAVFAEE